MKKIIEILVLFTLTSCSGIKFSISLTATGEYEDKVEYYQENQEYHKQYGINYYPLDNKIKISENKTIYLK
jgi:hypothetical protein